MATTSDIAHRWANQQFGKRDGTLTAGSTHCDEVSFYSYSTVIAQWLDKKRKIMAVIDVTLTKSTAGHICDVMRAIPHDVTVFRLHRSPGSYYSGYDNVDFCNWRGELDPMRVTNQYINLLYNAIAAVDDDRSLNPGNLHWWHELQRWEKYYPGASIKKYLRQKLSENPSTRKSQTENRKMLRALLNGATFEEIVDVVNGEGAWQRYLDRTKGARKTKAKREYAEKIARYIGYGSLRDTRLSVKELLALTPLQRVEIKLRNVTKLSWNQQGEHKERPVNNLLKYLGIKGEYHANGWFDFSSEPKIIHDPCTGELIYDASHRIDWGIPVIYFRVSDIEKVKEDPKKFREWFLAKARALGRLHLGCKYLHREDSTSPEQLEMVADYMNYKQKHDARAKTRQDRYEAERRRREEEEAEKERQRKLIIQSYQHRGIDGYRDLWRERFDQYPDTASFTQSEFYYGGNVLLRYNERTQMVETSKSIRLNIAQAKKLWRTVEIWHHNPKRFQRIEIKVQGSSYTAHSYNDDILIVGCHSIAYSEMRRMAHQLNFV